MRIESSDLEVTPDEYVQMLVSAVEVRVVATLNRLPPQSTLRPPQEVADLFVEAFERERARLAG